VTAVVEAPALPRPALEMADVVRRFGPAFVGQYGASLSPPQRRALSAIAA
jgi:hypothetical protein